MSFYKVALLLIDLANAKYHLYHVAAILYFQFLINGKRFHVFVQCSSVVVLIIVPFP